MSQKQPILGDTLAFVQKAGEALHASRQLAESVAVEQEKVANIVPRSADSMVNFRLLDGKRLINPSEKQAAMRKLATHQGAVELVHSLLSICSEQIKQAEQRIALLQQGKPVADGPQKQAAARNPVVGARHGDSDQPESWQKMAAALGVNR